MNYLIKSHRYTAPDRGAPDGYTYHKEAEIVADTDEGAMAKVSDMFGPDFKTADDLNGVLLRVETVMVFGHLPSAKIKNRSDV